MQPSAKPAPLPTGLTFTNNGGGFGTLSGTPAAGTGGTYSLTVTAANGVAPDATQTFTLTVNEAPAITSAAQKTFTVGQSDSFTVTTAGFPIAGTLSKSGALPTGLTFTDNHDGTATISGTPAAATGGTYTLTLGDTNGISPDASQAFTLTVNQAPAITSAASKTFTVGTNDSFTVTTTGFPTAGTLSEIGAPPRGPDVHRQPQRHRHHRRYPAAATGGTYTLTLGDTNGVAPDASQTFTLTVNQAPTITSAATTTFAVGQSGSFTVTTSGFPVAGALTEVGGLPSGVTFTDNHDGTATLAGTPAAATGGSYTLTLGDNNGVTPAAAQTFTLLVNQPPTITSAATTTFTVGQSGSFMVSTAGFPVAGTLTESGTLPTGLTFTDNHDGTATLSGTPAAATGGTYTLTLGDTNGVTPAATQTFTLVVNQAPAITSAATKTFTVGQNDSFTVTTSGFPVAGTLSESGPLPSGLTFTDNHDGTATLSGTPAAATGGSYTLTLGDTNGVTPAASQVFTLLVNQAPAITSAATTTFKVGQSSSFTVTTSGFPANGTLSESGNLPTGVTFTDNHDGTATLFGTPAAATGGSYTLTLGDTNGVAPAATQTFTLLVNQAPAITSAATKTFTVGQSDSFTVTTSGFPVAGTLSESGPLPSGLTFTDNHDGTATITGTPAAATGGAYTLTLGDTNGVTPAASQVFTLLVNQAPAITSAATTTFKVGQSGSFTVTTSGFPANGTLSESGNLPAGLTFTDNHDGTATLSGTPAAATGGSYTLTLGDTNGVTPAASQVFTLVVNQAPAITSAATTTFAVGQSGSFTVTTTGFPTAGILSESGALPTGVTFTDNHDGTATLSGTPAAGSGRTYALNLGFSNDVSPDATQTFTLTVDEAPAFTSAATKVFTVGSNQSFTVSTSGFPNAGALSEAGALPAGLSFTDNHDGTATISGTPAAATGGTYHLTLGDNNGISPAASQALTLIVQQAAAITSDASTTFTAGQPGSFTIASTGFPTGAMHETGNLPSGLSFVDNEDGTATIAGTPDANTGGTYNLVLTVSNGVVPDATQSLR